MSDPHDDKRLELYVELPNHWLADGGEVLWGKHLGGSDQYEITSIPHCAYGLNLGDVVYALAKADGEKPTVCKVVRPSDNTTLRLCFLETPINPDTQNRTIDTLEKYQCDLERANDRMLSISIPATSEYDAICDYLESLAAQELLEIESCETRVAGSFDEAPDER